MNLIDRINRKDEQIFFLGQGIDRKWKARKQYKSPNYTTRWEELPRVK